MRDSSSSSARPGGVDALTKTEVADRLERIVASVAATLAVETGQAERLLILNNWNEE